MAIWTATRAELDEDFALMVAAHRAYSAHYDAVEEGEAWLQAAAMAQQAREAGDFALWTDMQRLGAAIGQALEFKAGADAPSTRVAYHDATQDAVKILIPTAREMFKLMGGGWTRHKRVIGATPGTRPIMEGTNALLGPMTHDQAIRHLIWKDMPPGCNHYQVLTTDDLPRIDGCPQRARAFRAAWVLRDGKVVIDATRARKITEAAPCLA